MNNFAKVNCCGFDQPSVLAKGEANDDKPDKLVEITQFRFNAALKFKLFKLKRKSLWSFLVQVGGGRTLWTVDCKNWTKLSNQDSTLWLAAGIGSYNMENIDLLLNQSL